MKKRNYLLDSENEGGRSAFSVIADFEGNEERLLTIEVKEILLV